ncbi:MAG: InlB B-repeat-containing protein [Lachnospiraceae bacterium]|nr:InlB B-repeat-containing protein [Lachnospiraceae bacterium]
MKHTVYGISLAVLAVLAVAVVLGISGKNVRKNEMETALNTAIEQALEQLKMEKSGNGKDVRSCQELVADFNGLLLAQIESDSELQVEILTADAEKGILDVRITQSYQTILGREREAVCRKSVILEEYSGKREYHTVTFLVNGEIYSRYSLYEGGKIIQPKPPQREGKVFQYWSKQGEHQECALEQMTAEDDLILEAVFR